MISIKPKTCLHDEKVLVRIFSLKPIQKITISAHTKDNRDRGYFSYAHYVADSDGCIDLSKDSSLGGHYIGVFQMGLVSALTPEPNEYKFLRLFKKDVTLPTEIKFCVFDSHLTPTEIFQPETKPLFFALHCRLYMAKGVQRIPIREGKVRGTLFLPAGQGPFPGVIDLFGTAGGCLEYRSAQLASRGIASLALAFFNYDDLPVNLDILEISYFREAAQILLSYELICKPKIGAIGVSKGGDVVLSMAAYIPEVSLAICINGCYANLTIPMKIDDSKTIPPLLYDMSKMRVKENSYIEFVGSTNSPKDYPESIIPIDKTSAFIVFIVGEQDTNMDSKTFAKEAVQLMKENNKTNYKVLSYKEGGHLIEPPYSAFCPISYHKMIDIPISWGGNLEGHTFAQEDSWHQMIYFIKTHLRHQINSKL